MVLQLLDVVVVCVSLEQLLHAAFSQQDLVLFYQVVQFFILFGDLIVNFNRVILRVRLEWRLY